jgi:hypothetical protein
MIGLSLLMAFAFLVVVFTPDTEIGRAFRRVLVEDPARLLNGGPLKVFVALVVLVGLVAFAVGAPELVALIGMADLSVYLDLAVLAFMLSAATRLRTASRAGLEATKRAFGRLALASARLSWRRVRTRRTRRPRRHAANDDGRPSGVWAAA